MLKLVLTLFFLVSINNHWGLASHTKHCKVATMFGMKKCPPHWIHVYIMGLGSLIIILATLYQN